jgi:cell wall assembly regulator SMI1
MVAKNKFFNFLEKKVKVLYIDDARHHCDEVAKAFKKISVPCTCINYTAAEEKFDSFLPAQVHEEAEAFVGKDRYREILEESLSG